MASVYCLFAFYVFDFVWLFVWLPLVLCLFVCLFVCRDGAGVQAAGLFDFAASPCPRRLCMGTGPKSWYRLHLHVSQGEWSQESGVRPRCSPLLVASVRRMP